MNKLEEALRTLQRFAKRLGADLHTYVCSHLVSQECPSYQPNNGVFHDPFCDFAVRIIYTILEKCIMLAL